GWRSSGCSPTWPASPNAWATARAASIAPSPRRRCWADRPQGASGADGDLSRAPAPSGRGRSGTGPSVIIGLTLTQEVIHSMFDARQRDVAQRRGSTGEASMHSLSWNDGPGWHRADEIVRRVQAPTFPDRDVLVEDHGAVGDDSTDCTAAIAAAVRTAHRSGGGRVVLGRGTYRTGPIHLLSNVNLHVADGATVLFSTDPDRYLPLVPTRWQGVEVMGYSPLVYANDAQNVA